MSELLSYPDGLSRPSSLESMVQVMSRGLLNQVLEEKRPLPFFGLVASGNTAGDSMKYEVPGWPACIRGSAMLDALEESCGEYRESTV